LSVVGAIHVARVVSNLDLVAAEVDARRRVAVDEAHAAEAADGRSELGPRCAAWSTRT
jgi:hypothetical protein